MTEFGTYLALGFSALLPLINPPASALELMGVVGVGNSAPYKVLARKIAINTTLFLTVVTLTGPYVLHFFGISIEILQFMGGSILVAMGWQLLNKPDTVNTVRDPALTDAAHACVANYWQSRAFYPFTFPITVDPGAVAVMLTLSAQAKGLEAGKRLPALGGLLVCVLLLSALVYVFYAYAPAAAKLFPAPIVKGGLRIVAFLLMCIGAEIVWHGLRSMVSTVHS
jgi:multiple antibiotic resistance protein